MKKTDITSEFEDKNFLFVVSEMLKSKQIYKEDVEKIKELNVISCKIKKFNGIEYFTALETLFVDNNEFDEIDLSKNTFITNLSFDETCPKKIILSVQSAKKININFVNNKISSRDNNGFLCLEISDKNFDFDEFRKKQ